MRVVSGIIGLVLILVAVIIIVLSTGEESYSAKKEAMVQKYVANSQKALEQDNIKEAINFAKMAIEADVKNKAGFKAYEEALKTKYKPSEEMITSPVIEESPVEEKIEEAPDMGC